MLLEGAASVRLAPCHTAAPRPALAGPRPARVAVGWPSRHRSPRLNKRDTNGAERIDVYVQRDLRASESPPPAACPLRVGRRRNLGVRARAALVAAKPVLVQRAHLSERGLQLRFLKPCHRCRLRDPHPGEE
jgi:hypothetical protein